MGKFIFILVAFVLIATNSTSTSRFPNTIINNVEDPCIGSLVESSFSDGMINEISMLIKNVYSLYDTVNLTIDQSYDLEPSLNAITEFYYIGEAPCIDIHFNGNTMPGASKEYIMATLYHEFLHAIMFFKGLKDHEQHEPIATGYRKVLTMTLLQHFPGLSKNDASALVWEGLQDTKAWNNLFESHQATILDINQAFKTGRKGTKCK